ncbi:MAG TPA: hypothetical protein PLJ78_00365 [Anaerolineae bacterium]|nr:hypothetical protein [Anaerolineae bacterium]HQK12381.1 hypothetical protein [Anaerolineae bacterium]
MAEITVGYFLEDMGQEAFLQALVVRIAQDVGIDKKKLRHDSRSTTGGKGRAITELRRFLRDVQASRTTSFDVLVIAIDGNCQGYLGKRNELQDIVERSGYNGAVVYAIPDPHIERWYLEDAAALAQAIGANIKPDTPRYKCERGRYKNALREALKQAGVLPPLGGIEYAADIAQALDFYTIGKADAGFKHFEEELRGCLTTLTRSDRLLV